MPTTTSKFDVAHHLRDDQTIAHYLDDCMEEGGTRLFLKAVGEVARARGMSEIAASAGLTRASLYKSLGEAGNPALSTMERVIDSLGFRLAVVPKHASAAQAGRGKRITVRQDVARYGVTAKKKSASTAKKSKATATRAPSAKGVAKPKRATRAKRS